MSNFTRVYFPGLGIDFDLPSVAFTIGSYDIHFTVSLSPLALCWQCCTAAVWHISGV